MATRAVGLVEDVRSLGERDHVVVPYDDPGELRRQQVAFIGEGLARGMRVSYLSGTDDSLLAELRATLDVPGALQRGALVVAPMEASYASDSPVDPNELARLFTEATARAVAEGYSGLRAVGDATPFLRTDEQTAAFLRWEHVVDRLMARSPFSAMCGVDRNALGSDVLDALVCMHPLSAGEEAPFRLYAVDGADVALAGELDSEVTALLEVALERAQVEAGGEELTVDGRWLRFIDHRALYVLRDYARHCGAIAVLRTPCGLARRLIGLLEIGGIRAEDPEPGPERGSDGTADHDAPSGRLEAAGAVSGWAP